MIIRARPLGCFVVVALLLVAFLRSLAGGYLSTDGYFSDWWLKPNEYSFGERLELWVNKVESDLTQLPFGYYDLPFTCPPTPNKKPLNPSLSEIIRGDGRWQSDYKLDVGKDSPCEILCARKTTRQGLQKAKELVQQGYVVKWVVDDELPAATTFLSTTDEKKYYASGFPLGFVDPETKRVYLNNHVMLVIRYHVVRHDKVTIVGFEVYPKSVSDYHCPGASKDYAQFDITDEPSVDDTLIPVTYSVYWREEFDIDWSQRWSLFLNSGELSDGNSTTFHWMTLANSVGIVLLVTFIVVVNLVMIFRAQPDYAFDIDKESQGKAVYAVACDWLCKSRTQGLSMDRLTVCVSMGVQVMFMILGPLAISLSLNRLHNIRNSVLTIAILCFVASAFMASFVGTWLKMDHSMGGGPNSHHSSMFALLCGSALPAILTVVMLSLNCIIWVMDYTSAFPFRTFVLFGLWYSVICIILSLLGGSVAARMHRSVCHNTPPPAAIDEPASEKKSHDYKLLMTGGLISGLLPFVIIYVELQYVYKSVWLEKTTIYYLYSFLFANILLLCIVTCEISLLGCLVIMKLNHKFSSDRHWKWRSFFISTGCAWYMELYALYYIFCILNMRTVSSAFISVCYSLIFNTLCGLATGSLGYLSSSWFVNKVYRTKYIRK